MAKKYLINFCRSAPVGFRSAELNGLLELFGMEQFTNAFTEDKPHAVIETENEKAIVQLLKRSVLIKSATELFAASSSYDDLFQLVKNNRSVVESLISENSTFSFVIDSCGKKLNLAYQTAKVEVKFFGLLMNDPNSVVNCCCNEGKVLIVRKNEFSFLSIKGRVRLNKPDICFHVLEYYGTDANNVPQKPLEIYFGRLIGKGQYTAPGRYQIKHRKCIGNTSMDPLLTFIAANAASIRPNSLVFDPFVGTGSLLLPVAHFGAYCVGCDINYNLLHGSGKSSRHGKKFRTEDETVLSNFQQYGFMEKYLDVLTADSSSPGLWRKHDKLLFDTILTDPPYGIREKSLKVGARDIPLLYPGVELLCKTHPIRYPSKVKYSFYDVFLDLLNFAAEYLVLNGRLVYWFPIVYKNFDESIIPRHSCLALLTTAEQRLSSSHGRLMISMKKIKEYNAEDRAYVLRNDFQNASLRDHVYEKQNF